MERIITLLREKNHYLEKFHEVNDRELMHFEAGNYENIESFYHIRDQILDLIKYLDDLIQEENERCANHPRCTAWQKAEAEVLLIEKDQLVKQILAQDLQVISWVEKEKSNIIRELQAVRKGRKAMQSYHSGETSKMLDEKA